MADDRRPENEDLVHGAGLSGTGGGDLQLTADPSGPDGPQDDDRPAPKVIAGRSPFQQAMEQLRHDKVALVCGAIVLFFVLVAIFAPLITAAFGVSTAQPSQEELLDLTNFDGTPLVGPPNFPFTWEHPLGLAPGTPTDNFAYWVYGARTSIAIAFVSTAVATIIGILVGLVAGFARGGLAVVVNWVIDFFLSLPFLLVALSVAPILVLRFSGEPDKLEAAQFASLLVVLSAFGWMQLARLIRGEVLSLREREFVLAARAIGVPTNKILRRELLPNLVAPIIVSFSLGLPTFVSAEAGLAYLGIGVAGIPSWGQTINEAVEYFDTYPLFLYAPIVGVLVLVVALNLLGDSVRDAFDPKTRR